MTGQKIYGDYMFIQQLTIGGVGLTNLAVVFTDAHTFKQLGPRQEAGAVAWNERHPRVQESVDRFCQS